MRRLLVGFTVLWCSISSTASAAVKLPVIIGDNMVIQQGRAVPIWGWDDPNTTVTVQTGTFTLSARADSEGRWLVRLPKMKPGPARQITIRGTDERVLKNVLVGEVWLCSGQSNMEWTVAQSKDHEKERDAATYPLIRHIKIKKTSKASPQKDVPSTGWQVCSPDTVSAFTAVGYYFGRKLHKTLDVPVGLIGSNWGGTRIEPWTPPAGFRHIPALKSIADKLDELPPKDANGNVNPQSPLALYNGMIAPLVPYAIRGAIWYQGESNNGEGMLYHEKMKALIHGWRTLWQDEKLPFYFVQLAPYTYRGSPEALAGIWEAQLKTLSVPHTGMAVTVDIGNVSDIHPGNKQDVGKRLALWALAKTYDRKIVYSGPLYSSMKVEGRSIRISFKHIGGGLVSRDGKPLSHFQIAAKEGPFVDAKAVIDGDMVVVTAEGIEAPADVRFGWHQTAEPNLSNMDGLPASPFRTGR